MDMDNKRGGGGGWGWGVVGVVIGGRGVGCSEGLGRMQASVVAGQYGGAERREVLAEGAEFLKN